MRKLTILLVLALVPIWAGPQLLSSSSAAGRRHRHRPRVIRDKQAGRHTLKVTPPQQKDTAIEPSLAVNPHKPRNAVIAYQAGRVDAGCAESIGYSYTKDGGRTWHDGHLPKISKATGGTTPLVSDPVVAFGPKNIVYVNVLMCVSSENDLATSVSKDGGKTWAPPIFIPTEQTFPMDDKNWIVVDNSKAEGHHKGRIYLVWDDVAPVVAMYSDDQAQTWNGPYVISGGQGIGTIPLVMPNGDLAVVFNTIAGPFPPLQENPRPDPDDLQQPGKMTISFATGAGTIPTGAPLAFTPPITVGTDRGVDTQMQRAGEGLPTAGVDPKNGNMYVAWQDARFRTDDQNDIVIVKSTDGGQTWTDPKRVTKGPKNNYHEHFTPALAVGKDHIVRIAYRTQRQARSISNFSWKVDTYYRQGKNGRKWSKALRINRKERSDVRFAAYSRNSAFYGDYSQVGVTGSWAYIVRTESYRVKKKEKATFPPSVHHQRAWVAVVDADGNRRR